MADANESRDWRIWFDLATLLIQRARKLYASESLGVDLDNTVYALDPERIAVFTEAEQVANHTRSFERDRTIYDWQHYIPLIERKPGALRNGAPFAEMPEPLRKLRSILLHKDGGDRAMARVLTAIPGCGLEAVLIAVELALESGAANAEQVLNILARLNQPPPPEPIPTALEIKEAPTADSGRYDRLHTIGASHVSWPMRWSRTSRSVTTASSPIA